MFTSDGTRASNRNLTGFEGHFEIYRGSCDSLEAISALAWNPAPVEVPLT